MKEKTFRRAINEGLFVEEKNSILLFIPVYSSLVTKIFQKPFFLFEIQIINIMRSLFMRTRNEHVVRRQIECFFIFDRMNNAFVDFD